MVQLCSAGLHPALLCSARPASALLSFLTGGFFEHITAANYFGELVEWGGYALASWSLQASSFAFFSFCFLFPRAQQHHR